MTSEDFTEILNLVIRVMQLAANIWAGVRICNAYFSGMEVSAHWILFTLFLLWLSSK